VNVGALLRAIDAYDGQATTADQAVRGKLPLQQLQIIANYAHTNAIVTRDEVFLAGDHLLNVALTDLASAVTTALRVVPRPI
jgi:hypothetical protein